LINLRSGFKRLFMQNIPVRKTFPVLIWLFLGFTVLFAGGWAILSRKPVDFEVLLTGNGLLFAVSLYSMRSGIRALRHKNVTGFLRLVYSSLLIKLFLLSLGAFIYIIRLKQEVNKPALFGCFGLYLIYSFTEVRMVMQQSKQKNA
jgi:hypothetical protein